MNKGLRYNKGKNRVDLVPVSAVGGIAEVLGYGAEKYTIRDTKGNIISSGDNNWRLGLPWTSVYASLQRHLNKWKSGEDFDSESGLLHIDHVLTNAAFLKEYITIYPQGDDRNQWFKKPLKKLWLDIDGVIADFESHFVKWLKLPSGEPTDWDDPKFRDNFNKIAKVKSFWKSIPRLIDPKDIDYPIAGYCTSRPIDDEVTQQWLDDNVFPKAPLVNTFRTGNKVDFLKTVNDLVFIDDSIKNFAELQSNGILCYLKTRPHNAKYNVGIYRMESLEKLIKNLKN